MAASVRSWAQGEGGQIAQSLRQGLQLLEDVHFFSDSSGESLATRLQWHSIVVIHLVFLLLLQKYRHIFFCLFIFIDIVVTGSTIGLYN